MTSVLVTGVTGQDGSYLAERLVAEGHEVHGLVRPGGGEPLVADGVVAHEGDLRDPDLWPRLLRAAQPEQVFHLAGISSVAQSWQDPVLTAEVTGLAVARLLAAVQDAVEATGRQVRVLQASSAEVFGDAEQVPQDERTPLRPVSPYGAAKAYAQHLVGVHRGRGLHASCVVLYGHESPRRPTAFVTRKITQGAAEVALGRREDLALGNLEARRDWGWAPDYVDAMVRAVRRDEPGDYVVATGETHTVGEFVAAAFRAAGVEDGERRVRVDPRFFRPADAAVQVGDAGRARRELGWAPTVPFEDVVARMVEHDLALLRG